ncbi:MAG: prolyl oligopeptidase family serine peptidase [Bacteroidetes bacterium]|nr:prolyl oligopeptidase family serine peptidase [Bacteroidota bacterium]
MLYIKLNSLIFVFILASRCIFAQYSDTIKYRENIYDFKQLKTLLKKPDCLNGYFPNQTGFLSKIDNTGKESFDTTFTIQQLKIPSDDIFINGWLYLPLGKEKFPLIILTNGGGNITKNARSFSDWLAPIFAHCGIAAFVHDKRGTGESEGVFTKTTYEDYIEDVRNCAFYLSKHERIDSGLIGIAGASEGGRIAVIAAGRYPIFKFVISFAGTVVSSIDDRIYAQKGWLKSLNLPDSTFFEVFDLHEKSIRAWAINDTKEHEKVNAEIIEMRKKYDEQILPYTKEEMESIPEFAFVLSTWNSLQYDYLTEMVNFNKKWLAIFGKEDIVVPTEASIKNIIYYMNLSNNDEYNIAVLPDCGHVPINTKTKRLIRLDNIMINWINANILNEN